MTPAQRVLRSYELAAQAKAIGNGDPGSGLKALAWAVGSGLADEIGAEKAADFLQGVAAITRDIRPANDVEEVAA